MTTIILLYSAFALGVGRVMQKKMANDIDPDSFTYLIQLVSAIALGLVFLASDEKLVTISLSSLLMIVLAGAVWQYASVVSTRSIRAADVTLREPLLQTRQLFVLLLGVMFLGESLDISKSLGVLMIIVGAVLASYKGKINYINTEASGVLICIYSALLTALAYALDKYNLDLVSPFLYATLMYIVPLLIMAKDTKKHMNEINSKSLEFRLRAVLLIIFQTSGFLAFIYALKSTPVTVAYPIMSLSFIFVFLGGYFILGENTNWKRRLIGGVIAVLGTLFIS